MAIYFDLDRLLNIDNSFLVAIGFVAGIGFWLNLLYRSNAGKLSNRQIFLFVFVVGFACRIAFAIGTPDFYAPDEQSHFNYVRFLADHRSFPIQTSRTGADTNDWEYYQPPLYYLVQVPVYILATELFQDKYYLIRSLRFTSILLWICTVGFALWFLRILEIDNELLQVVVMGLVCLLPTYTFLSSMINNDNMIIFIGGLLLCSIARRDLSVNTAIVTGILLGLALLTKLSAVVYCPAIVALAVLHAIRVPLKRRPAIVYLMIVVTVSALIWLPWATRNLYVYGSITAEHVANVPVAWPTMAVAVYGTLSYMSGSFWSVSGIYNNVHSVFPQVGMPLSIFSLSGLIYALWSGKRLNAVFASELDGRFLIAMSLSIAVNVLLVLRFGILYGQGQGRFLFPLLLPISLFLGIGLCFYQIKNFGIHLSGFFITYAVTFTLFSLGSFPRM